MNTAQLAREIVDEVRRTGNVREAMRTFEEAHPDLSEEQVGAAAKAAANRLRDIGQEAKDEADAMRKLHALVTSLPGEPGEAVVDKLKRAADAGNEEAAAALKLLLGTVEDRVFWQLACAAAEAHPDWKVVDHGEYKGLARVDGSMDPLADDPIPGLIDWYQLTYPSEAKAIEDRVRGEAA